MVSQNRVTILIVLTFELDRPTPVTDWCRHSSQFEYAYIRSNNCWKSKQQLISSFSEFLIVLQVRKWSLTIVGNVRMQHATSSRHESFASTAEEAANLGSKSASGQLSDLSFPSVSSIPVLPSPLPTLRLPVNVASVSCLASLLRTSLGPCPYPRYIVVGDRLSNRNEYVTSA